MLRKLQWRGSARGGFERCRPVRSGSARCVLLGTNLFAADLAGAEPRGGDLTVTNLPYANLRGADLGEAILEGTNLYGADLFNTNLVAVNLLGGTRRDGVIIRVE